MRRRLLLLLPALLLPALLLAACGIKGPLRQKGAARPAAPPGLTLAQQGDELLLSWQLPTSNQDGSALTDLAGFDIYRLAYLPQDYCEECRDPETPVVRISLDYPAPASRRDDRLFWRDARTVIGTGYRYRVVPITRSGQAGNAASSHRTLLVPPTPPPAFTAAPLDRGARLAWQAPADLDPALELVGVQVYRALGDAPLQAVGGSAQTGDHYDDFGLQNDQPYRYGLRSVARSGAVILESALSELLTVTPDAEL